MTLIASGPSTRNQNNKSRFCSTVGLPHVAAWGDEKNLWWADAPIYSRYDFVDFIARVNWTMITQFDHASYAATKRTSKVGQVRRISDHYSESLTCPAQDKYGGAAPVYVVLVTHARGGDFFASISIV